MSDRPTDASSVLPDLDLRALAATVVWDLDHTDANDAWDRGRVSGVVAAWQSLTGIHDRAECIELARTLVAQAA